LPVHQELGKEVLRFRRLVQARDPAQVGITARGAPFLAKHFENGLRILRPRRDAGGQAQHGLTAGALGPQHFTGEHEATSVGVDLDEARALLVEVEVIGQDSAGSCAVYLRHRGASARAAAA